MNRLPSWLSKLQKPASLRMLIQVLVFLGALLLPVGIFHMICPFGGIVTLTRLFEQGLYIPKTGITNLVIIGSVILATIVAGPVFCGWLCPLGSIQDWIRALTCKRGIKALRIPKTLDRILSLSRYVVLFLILRATVLSFNLIFISMDPYYALFHFWTGEVAPQALVILSIVLITSIFIERPWCRWFCPLGAILSLIGRFSIIKIHKPSSKCISCSACSRACPVGLDPAAADTVKSLRCIRCGLCAASCPPKLCTERNSFKIHFIVALFILVVLFISPHLIPGTNEHSSGEETTRAELNFEVKPQTRLAELAEGSGKNLEEIYALLSLPEEYDDSTRLIDIEDDFEELTWGHIQQLLEK